MLNYSANGPSGYNLTNSLRFRSSASAYLNRTPATSGNGQTYTISFWIKFGTLPSNILIFEAGTGGTARTDININASGSLQFYDVSTSDRAVVTTNAVYRDPAAWYHFVVTVNTTLATATDRIKIYQNGVQQAVTITTQIAQNVTTFINGTYSTRIATASYTLSNFFDGYLAEFNLIDGQALTPSSFGSTNSTTGVWQPAKYTGTYGTNGFYLKFSDIATTSGSNAGLGKDFSGNGNYWNTNNISVTSGTTYDAMTDVPTLTSATVANYCTLNPLSNLDATTLASGNLNLTQTTGSSSVFGTIGVSSGKWYWEVICQSGIMVGVADTQRSGGTYPGGFANSCAWDTFYTLNSTNAQATGTFTKAGTISGSAGTAGQVIGTALDMDAGTIVYYINGSVQNSGNAVFTNITGTVYPVFRGSTTTSSVNFGQRPFSYTPPTGYLALNTYNLPTSTIVQGNKYMDATLYTGNLTGQSITNAASFKPDLVWIKSRSAATDNKLTDSVRGATKAVISNTTGAETTDLTGMTAFNTNGFTVGASTVYNNTSATYVGWQWQAGQGSTSSNTSGTITSTVSVNATAGCSVVTYTGTGANATVGHGLGVAPKMMIVKRRNTTGDWSIYNSNLGANKVIWLNQTTASTTDGSPGHWNNTAPTSSVFTVGTDTDVNASTSTYVAYCWAEITGFSKFGSYTGNGSADGPFVYLGFRPKYVLIKRTDTTASWEVIDTARDPYNTCANYLYPNLSDAEVNAPSNTRDYLSNGFKIRHSGSGANASGGTYIYMAFAENPFKNSLAR